MKIKFDTTSFLFLLVIILYVMGKVLFNDEGDSSSSVNLNTSLYLNAVVSMTILGGIFFYKKNKLSYKNYTLFLIVYLYYFIALLSTSYSLYPLLTLYNSLTGILFVSAALVIGEQLTRNIQNPHYYFERFIKFLYIFSAIGIIANIYFYAVFFGITDFIKHGIPSGFIALLILYLSFILFVYKPNIKRRTLSIILFIGVLFLKSFASYLAFFVMILFYLAAKKKFFWFFSLTIASIFITISAIAYLGDNIGEIAINSKPAEAYLTGSGRFILYETAIDIFSNEFHSLRKIFGVGFMSERQVLMNRDLPWVTDPHSAPLLNLLGLGLIGILFYFTFLFYPFIFYIKIKRYKSLKQLTLFWLCFHILAIVYSFSSSYYLGRPSFILLFSLIFYYILHFNFIKIRRKNQL